MIRDSLHQRIETSNNSSEFELEFEYQSPTGVL